MKKPSTGKTPEKKPVPAARPKPAKDRERTPDSDDVERAVYDGMQDLRTEKPGDGR